ncbi:cytochrome b5-related protein-like [Venturia canescens]|uniref:cytochrome b5-related protein-like n=1 Tax=Venturia canescens TaxID=32260 RepID=UPI001C9C7F5C|nr:cytochrome b5-related protein-like [Venturia canescens]
MGREIDSSVPGLSHLPILKGFTARGESFLEARKEIDGAENLWRIGNNLYDLRNFIKSHPGGQEWIAITRGTDITELFESHHLTNRARKLLPKFFVREATTKRNTPWTFNNDDFYSKFKQRALEALKDVDYHRPSIRSNLIADSLLFITLLSSALAAKTETWSAIFFAGLSLALVSICGHNYLHMRDNIRMYYLDISLMSSKDWRFTHVSSHHMYPNTLWDYEIYAFMPFFKWLPNADKSLVQRFLSVVYCPVIWALFFLGQGIKRYYAISKTMKMDSRDLVPFIIPFTMLFFGSSPIRVILVWLMIIVFASFVFIFLGLNAAHHHPDIFHDGDTHRENFDWGLFELDAVRDRRIIDDISFLTLTTFGAHTLHHLLPTVDHAYLPLCEEALNKTCEEFGISNDKFSFWELIKGQFKQLARVQGKSNFR